MSKHLENKIHLASSKGKLSLPRREHRVPRSGSEAEDTFYPNLDLSAEGLCWINPFTVLPEKGHHCPAIEIKQVWKNKLQLKKCDNKIHARVWEEWPGNSENQSMKPLSHWELVQLNTAPWETCSALIITHTSTLSTSHLLTYRTKHLQQQHLVNKWLGKYY